MNKKFRRIMALLTSLTMLATSGEYVFASSNQSGTIRKTADEVVRDIVVDTDFTQGEREKIKEDIELLEGMGIEISAISSVSVEDEFVYYLPVKENLMDEIVVENNNGDVIMNVVEGDIHNELIIKSDGTMFLDGKEVIFETETINLGSVSGQTITPKTGGIQWYAPSDAPSYLKDASYGSYSVSWKCSSVNLQKSLSSIAYATFMGVITGGLLGGVLGFTTTAFYELITYNPNSTCVSYIDYVARGSSVARYYKGRRYTYAAKNYEGKKTITYSYGIML